MAFCMGHENIFLCDKNADSPITLDKMINTYYLNKVKLKNSGVVARSLFETLLSPAVISGKLKQLFKS